MVYLTVRRTLRNTLSLQVLCQLLKDLFTKFERAENLKQLEIGGLIDHPDINTILYSFKQVSQLRHQQVPCNRHDNEYLKLTLGDQESVIPGTETIGKNVLDTRCHESGTRGFQM